MTGGTENEGSGPETTRPSLRERPGDQPLPVPNDEPDIQSLVMRDIVMRRAVGIKRYGTALQPNNGRDALRDAYEEALDLAMYLRQARVEHEGMVLVSREDLRALLADNELTTEAAQVAYGRLSAAAEVTR